MLGSKLSPQEISLEFQYVVTSLRQGWAKKADKEGVERRNKRKRQNSSGDVSTTDPPGSISSVSSSSSTVSNTRSQQLNEIPDLTRKGFADSLEKRLVNEEVRR